MNYVLGEKALSPLIKLFAHAQHHNVCHRGSPKTEIEICLPQIVYAYSSYMGLRCRLSEVCKLAFPCLSDFARKITVCTSHPKVDVFEKNKSIDTIFSHLVPQGAHPSYERRVLTLICLRIHSRCGLEQVTYTVKQETKICRRIAKLCISGTGAFNASAIQCCMPADVFDIILYTNFGEYRLNGFDVTTSRILGFSIDLRRRQYNSCNRWWGWTITLSLLTTNNTSIWWLVTLVCFNLSLK